MRVRSDDSTQPVCRARATQMRLKIATLAAAVAVAVLLYVYLISSGFSIYSEGVSLTYHADPDAARENAGGHITRITDDDLAGIPKVKHMLGLALEQGPVVHGNGFVVLDTYLNSYRVSDHPIGDGVRVSTSLSLSDMNRYAKWIDANLGSSYFEYEGKIFSFWMWAA